MSLEFADFYLNSVRLINEFKRNMSESITVFSISFLNFQICQSLPKI